MDSLMRGRLRGMGVKAGADDADAGGEGRAERI